MTPFCDEWRNLGFGDKPWNKDFCDEQRNEGFCDKWRNVVFVTNGLANVFVMNEGFCDKQKNTGKDVDMSQCFYPRPEGPKLERRACSALNF